MKSLLIDQIEITKTGNIQIRMQKLSSDGDLIGNHRTSVESNGDVEAQIAAVNSHMATENFAPISDVDIARVKAVAAAAWNT